MVGERFLSFFAILILASGQLECPQLYCSSTQSTLCYNYYSLTGSAIINPCPSGMVCPYSPPVSESQLYCTPEASTVTTSLPGSKCSETMPCAKLDNVACVKGVCSGIAANSACTSTDQCLPGLYCQSLICKPLLLAGATCQADDYCTYGYQCSQGKCVSMYSIQSGTAVDTVNCVSGSSTLCQSGVCYTDNTQKSTCINPYESNIVDNKPCTTCEGVSVTGAVVLTQKANCVCGLSGQSHCPEFNGDEYSMKLQTLIQEFQMSSTRKKCHIDANVDCMQSYYRKGMYLEYMYYTYKAKFGHIAYGGDNCLVSALMPMYYESGKDYRIAQIEDVGIFAALALAIYEVYKAYF